jgi:hypothetical protein
MLSVLIYVRSCYTGKCKTRSKRVWTEFLYGDSIPAVVISYRAGGDGEER